MAQRLTKKIQLRHVIATVGTWALTVASNLVTLDKSAADDTSVLYVPIVPEPELPHARARDIKYVRFQWSNATAALDAAPTAVLSKVTKNTTTKVRTRATVTQTLTISGTDATGTAVGTFEGLVTPSTPVRLEDNEELWLEITINAGATSVVKLGAVEFELA